MGLLETQLQECGCTLAPDEFRKLIITTFGEMFGEMTDEQMLCLPGEAKRFAMMIRHLTGCKILPYSLINRTLLNARKAGRMRTGKRHRSSVIKLKAELESVGCELDSSAFRDLLADVFAEMFRDITDEAMICNPDLSQEFVYKIRGKSRCRHLSDAMILRNLLNIRKHSISVA